MDLHLHTIESDGIYKAQEVIDRAYASGIRTLSITDHDSIDAYKDIKNLSIPSDLRIIKGVELSLFTNYGLLHLLVYDFDEKKMERFLNRDTLSGKSLGEYFAKMRMRRMKSPEDLFAEIKRTKGKTFLAHPYRYTQDKKGIISLARTLKELGMDGIECFHPSASAEDTKFLRFLANEFNLLICGGSDYHGTPMRDQFTSTGAVSTYDSQVVSKWF